jgi:co-chaperonin GroES (HSP10)
MQGKKNEDAREVAHIGPRALESEAREGADRYSPTQAGERLSRLNEAAEAFDRPPAQTGFGKLGIIGEGRALSGDEQRIAEEIAGTTAEDLWQNVEGTSVPADLLADLASGAAGVLFWRALIMPVRPLEKSKGGIVLVHESQENAQYLTYIGKLIAIGPLWCDGPNFAQYGREPGLLERLRRRVFGARDQVPAWRPELAPGDWVIYGRHAGQRVEYKGVRFLLVNDDEKLMKIRSPAGWRIYS